MKKNVFYIIILTVLTVFNVNGQEPLDIHPGTVDTSIVDFRSEYEYFRELADSRVFEYNEAPPTPNLIELAISRVMEWINEFLRQANQGGYQMAIMIAVLIVIIIFAVWKLSGSNVNSLFSASSASLKPEVLFDEDIENANFEILVQEAIKRGDYRSAIRFGYLNALKALTAKGIISYAPAKTNFEYLYELKDPAMRSSFKTISLLFNYSEYGHFDIREQDYSRAKNHFEMFNSLIKGSV